MKNTKNENGRSMIEMLGVLAIIGVLSVGGIAGYSKAMQRYRINKCIDQITYMAGAIRTFFAPQKNYMGLSDSNVSLLKKAKLVPDDMWGEYVYYNRGVDNYSTTGNGLTSPFGTQVSLYPEHKNSIVDYRAFSITYKDLSPEVCIELATQDWTTADVGVVSLGGADHNFYYVMPPLSVDKAITLCNSNYTNVSFIFDVDVNYWKSLIDQTNSKWGW